jgi:PAS domain S-box-containing protein
MRIRQRGCQAIEMGTRFFTLEAGFLFQSFLTKSILFRAILRKEGIKMDASIKNEKLNIEQIQKLSEHTIFGISATLINSLILSLILWNVAPKMSVIIWFFLLISVSLVRFFLQRSYSKAMPEFEKAKKWEKWFLLTIALSGVIWGSAGIFLFPPDSIGHQTFIAFVLGGMVAGSVGLFSVILTAFLAYSIPALLPIVIMFFSVKDEIHIAMGIMGILFWLIMFFTAKRLNKTIATSLNLKHENVDLISELLGEIKERKEIEKELLRKHEEIEGIVEKRTSELRDVNKKLVEEIEVRKNAENAFRESEIRLRTLINYAPVVLWAIDRNGVFTFSEGKGLEAINLGPGEVIGKSLFEMYKDNKQFVDDTRRALSGTTVSTTTKVDGIIFEIRYEPIFDEKNSVTGAIGVAVDVTERKKVEKAIELSKKEWESTFDAISDWISLIDLKYRILRSNRAGENFISLPIEEMIDRTCCELIYGKKGPIPECPMEKMLQTHQCETVELYVQNMNRWLMISVYPITDKDGNLIRAVHIARDITKRKKIEEERKKLITELQEALKEIKTLRGILPFCSFCKKIRDDKGYWEQVDVYIHKYSQADISHSICPECMKKHYPEEYEDVYPTEE